MTLLRFKRQQLIFPNEGLPMTQFSLQLARKDLGCSRTGPRP
jgi:hypothetical protein